MAYRNSMLSFDEMNKLLEKEFAKYPNNWKNVVSDPSPRIEWNHEKDCAIVRKRDGTSVEIPRYKPMELGKKGAVNLTTATEQRIVTDYYRYLVDHRERELERDRQMQNSLEQARASLTPLERRLQNVKSVAESNYGLTRYHAQERYTTTGMGSPLASQLASLPVCVDGVRKSLAAARTPRRTFWAVLRNWFGRITRLNRDTAASDATSSSQAAVCGKGGQIQRDSLGARYKNYF